jgi:alpha-L-rhamnosidase
MKKILSIAFLMLSAQHILTAQSVEFKSLTCDAQINPIAIESQQPLLSWVVEADGYNREQTAYQVLVASKETLLNEKNADLWNSGKVVSTQSAHVKYQGEKLLPTQKHFWKVMIWDEVGKASDWSAVNTFEMGLMDDANWGDAQWISLSKDTRTSEYRFRDYTPGWLKENPPKVTSQAVGYFRNVINTEKETKSARAYICGLGYYELYINGEKTGDHVLDPAPSNYDKQAYYVSYDVSDQIKAGKNAIGIILGNGFYGQTISWKRDPDAEKDFSFGVPAVKLLIKVTYKDGSQADFYTDEYWKNSTGPIVFDNVYGGDTYDARFEINGWNTVKFNDKSWAIAKIVSPELTKVSANQMPPIRKLQEIDPQKVFESPEGDWIVDFGQNIAGWVKINVKGEKGQVINISTTECLTKNGEDVHHAGTGGGANGMPQLYTYICKGKDLESWEPKFSYHGFRYAKMMGITEKPDANMIKAVLVATDIKETGAFSCSDPRLNKMHTISKWTIVDNLHGIPEDCPHREKCGWLGDAHAFAEYALYNYDMNNFYKKYMEDIRTQRSYVEENDSEQKFLVPTMVAPGKRGAGIAKLDWGIAAIYLPWYSYKFYGDSSVVLDYYEDMKELTNYYLSFKNEKGIIDNGMGDWCPPRWDRQRNPGAMECNPIVSANAYFYDILGIMELLAAMNKDAEFKAKMKTEKKALFDAFNAEYLTEIPLAQYKWYGSQTATVMAIQFGMVNEDDIQKVLDGLEFDIVAERGGHHTTGIHGGRYIYSVLNKYGKADLAHHILTTPTFPSQTYIMNYGFTTWPERQFYWDAMPQLSNSLNHPMNSGFAAYFFETLGGIKTSYETSGFKEFTVNPIFQKEITQTTVKVPTPYGNIYNNWKLNDTHFSMDLNVPFNTKAKLVLTKSELASLTINGDSWADFQKKYKAQLVDNSVVLLGSGVYNIEYEKQTE